MNKEIEKLKDKIKRLDKVYGKGFFNESVETQKKEIKQKILKELTEKLADLEHQQWSHWTRYFLDNQNPTNRCKWVFQLETPYSELSEKEKESDRKWARKVLEIISEYLDEMSEEEKEEKMSKKNCEHPNKEFEIDEKRFFCEDCNEWINCEDLQ